MRFLLIMLLVTGCHSFKMAEKQIKTYLKHVDENYDCIGVEIVDDAAICIDDVAVTITVTF